MMKDIVIHFLFAGMLLTSGLWLLENKHIVDEYITSQVNSQVNVELQLGLQENESWIVVVVDFPDSPSDGQSSPEAARNLLSRSAQDYLYQLSGNQSRLELEVYNEVVRASKPSSYYGADHSERDTSSTGDFLPIELAEEVVIELQDTIDWSKYDLNGDGTVDRFLILHSTKGQEERVSSTSRIWSHFTQFDDPLTLGDGLTIGHYTMASLATGNSGIGTILHEMLHQMGAIDLYPIETSIGSQPWNGLGEWDIMASGNWNGAGQWPSLPSSTSIELLGIDRIDELDLTWPEGSVSPCIGPTIPLVPLTEGGNSLKIQISTSEFVFIEYRNQTGYDTRLPGSGVLVSIQDTSVGNMAENSVNTNSNRPFSFIVEADQNNGLLTGLNEGEAGDLFWHNQTFGSSGAIIRTHDGFKVDWLARVMVNESVTVSFSAEHCSSPVTIDLPDFSSYILPNQPIDVRLDAQVNCTSMLTTQGGASVNWLNNGGLNRQLILSYTDQPNHDVVKGQLNCNGYPIYFEYPVYFLKNIPVNGDFEATIHPIDTTYLTIPIQSVGEGEQIFNVYLEGPLERVGVINNQFKLTNSSSCVLEIQPQGLLTENMLVNGKIIFATNEGEIWEYDIRLKATSQESGFDQFFSTPATTLAFGLIGLAVYISVSTFAGLVKPKKVVDTPEMGMYAIVPSHVPTHHWEDEIDERSMQMYRH